MAFDRFCLTVSLAMPLAVLLSVWSGVAGCGWPSSSKAMRMGQMVCAFRNSAPNSASAALAMTDFMIWHNTGTGPLSGSGSSVAVGGFDSQLLRKQYPAAWDLPLGAVKYEALLWVHKTMSLAWYRMTACG